MEILGVLLITLGVILLIIGILFPRPLTEKESALVEKYFPQSEWHIEKYVVDNSEWIELVEGKYPTGSVVLVACDTSDCGWTIETCWWSEDNKCWYITGVNGLFKAHLPYTHYRKLPNPPKNNK